MMVLLLATCWALAGVPIYASASVLPAKIPGAGGLSGLGATRRQLGAGAEQELIVMALVSCSAGMALGDPLALGVWQIFRAMVVDTEEMVGGFEYPRLSDLLIFSLFILLTLFVMGGRHNPPDQHPGHRAGSPEVGVHPPGPRWKYGPVGILLLAVGGFLGYFVPRSSSHLSGGMPPVSFTACSILPALLTVSAFCSTVVNSWGGRNGSTRI